MSSINRDIERCRDQNRRAQSRVYYHYAPLMKSVAMRYLVNSIDADAVLTTSFFKAFKDIDKCKDLVKFGAWLRRIVINEALQTIRKRGFELATESEKFLNIECNDSDEDYLVKRDVTQEEIFEAIEGLPEKGRTVLNMYLLDGYSHRDIASYMGISEGTSQAHLRQARLKLKELLSIKL